MPNIQENPEKLQALFDAIRSRGKYDEVRKGTHLSDLLYCNYKTYFRKKGLQPKQSDEQILLFTLGYALQYFLFPKNKEKVYEKDGILCRPDVENEYLMEVEIPLAEVKSTRVSINNFKLADSPHYVEQMAGYCVVKDVLECSLITFFVMGNYRPPFPKAKVWDVKFTQQELDDYWETFLVRKTNLEWALKHNTLPQTHFRREDIKKKGEARYWECKYCEVRDSLCPLFGE